MIKNIKQILSGAFPSFAKYKSLIKKIILCNLLTLIFEALIASWYGSFYNTMVAKKLNTGIIMIVLFVIYEFFYAFFQTKAKFLEQKISFTLRALLYRKYGNQEQECPNPCQRVTYDLEEFSVRLIDFFVHLIKFFVAIPIYLYLIYTTGNSIIYPVIALIYITLNIKIGQSIGKKLTNYSSLAECTEGKLRKKLVFFYENKGKFPNLYSTWKVKIKLITKEQYFNFFVSFTRCLVIVIPYSLLIYKICNGSLVIGSLVQFRLCFAKLQMYMSYFASSRAGIIELRTSTTRLAELKT